MRRAIVSRFLMQPATWQGLTYLAIFAAADWWRGGPARLSPSADTIAGAAVYYLAFYGTWYGLGLFLLYRGWRKASR